MPPSRSPPASAAAWPIRGRSGTVRRGRGASGMASGSSPGRSQRADGCGGGVASEFVGRGGLVAWSVGGPVWPWAGQGVRVGYRRNDWRCHYRNESFNPCTTPGLRGTEDPDLSRSSAVRSGDPLSCYWARGLTVDRNRSVRARARRAPERLGGSACRVGGVLLTRRGAAVNGYQCYPLAI